MKGQSIAQQRKRRIQLTVLTIFGILLIIGIVLGAMRLYSQNVKTDKVEDRADVVQAPVKGDKNAKVQIIAFTDFRCIHCRNFHKDMENQIQSYIDDGDVSYRNIQHPVIGDSSEKFAFMADGLAKYATDDDYWKFSDLAYEHFEEQNPVKILDKTHITKDKRDKVMDYYNKHQSDDYDKSKNKGLGVEVTPTIFINNHNVGDASKLEEQVKERVYK